MRISIRLVVCISVGCMIGGPSSEAASPTNQPSSATVDKQIASAEDVHAENAGEDSAPTKIPRAVDVALSGEQQVLWGQVVDPTGAAVPNMPVSLRAGNRVLARTESNAGGRFAFKHLRGGVYQVVADEGFTTIRAWSADTAPKTAEPKALVVVGRGTVRAQRTPRTGMPQRRGGRWLSRPLVVAGIVGAAVAVPLSLHDSKTNDDNGAVAAVPTTTVKTVTGGPASP